MLVMYARVALQHLNLNRTPHTQAETFAWLGVLLKGDTHVPRACAAHSIALDYYKVNDTTEKREREKKTKTMSI